MILLRLGVSALAPCNYCHFIQQSFNVEWFWEIFSYGRSRLKYGIPLCCLCCTSHPSAVLLAWETLLRDLVADCRRFDMDLRDERDLAYQRLLKICQAGFLSIYDFRSILAILIVVSA